MLIIWALLIIPIILAQYLHLCSISDDTYVFGKGHIYAIHSISKSFPNIAFETVPTFVQPWSTLILSMKMSSRTFHLYTADRNMVKQVLQWHIWYKIKTKFTNLKSKVFTDLLLWYNTSIYISQPIYIPKAFNTGTCVKCFWQQVGWPTV